MWRYFRRVSSRERLGYPEVIAAYKEPMHPYASRGREQVRRRSSASVRAGHGYGGNRAQAALRQRHGDEGAAAVLTEGARHWQTSPALAAGLPRIKAQLSKLR